MTPAPEERCVVVDVHYPAGGGARGAAVVCADRRCGGVVGERVVEVAGVADYRPGRFFLRELPVLRAVLDEVGTFGLLVVDGYVDLEPGRPGLGAHCHEEFGVPVVGIAKTAFRAATHAAPVVRGGAAKPLHVTAAGLSLADAAAMVAGMAGPYRLPDAARRADALARGRGEVGGEGAGGKRATLRDDLG